MSTNHDSKFVQTVSGTLERPRYSPGLILEDSDLTAAVDYTRDLNRLMFRSLFGCGVVCGLIATADEKCGLTITVQSGLAIAPCGDPINVSRPVTIVIDKPNQADYWILLRNKQRTCENRAVMCDDDDDDAPDQPTRIKDCAEISIVCDFPKCACMHWMLRGWRDGVKEVTPTGLQKVAQSLATDISLPPDAPTNIDCPICTADCGCGGDDYVVIGWVHKFEAEWGVLHRGVRRFVRPALLADTAPNFQAPVVRAADTSAPVADGGDAEADSIKKG